MGGYKGVKTIKHMVWDWNGTLMNDVGLCLDITNQMLQRRGLAQVDSTLGIAKSLAFLSAIIALVLDMI